ncbi:hypothetical protein BCR34DRAFT_556691 [Clohesyomyces aquaticus]|uniref:Uncharacterized protein n=1 Tax=Clohesyomyces aquaticus TaxID=1231657 RepID=A0A1Y2A2Z9_9PLEO|nr:hypothetical protein BCR34DRAFT_556691 [Clohesyomyces aquaticus]
MKLSPKNRESERSPGSPPQRVRNPAMGVQTQTSQSPAQGHAFPGSIQTTSPTQWNTLPYPGMQMQIQTSQSSPQGHAFPGSIPMTTTHSQSTPQQYAYPDIQAQMQASQSPPQHSTYPGTVPTPTTTTHSQSPPLRPGVNPSPGSSTVLLNDLQQLQQLQQIQRLQTDNDVWNYCAARFTALFSASDDQFASWIWTFESTCSELADDDGKLGFLAANAASPDTERESG